MSARSASSREARARSSPLLAPFVAAALDEQQRRRGREGAHRRLGLDRASPWCRPHREYARKPEWPYSANPLSPARSAAVERRSRCQPTPASSSTSARAAANGCDLGTAIAACSALSATCGARRSRAPADRIALDVAEGRAHLGRDGRNGRNGAARKRRLTAIATLWRPADGSAYGATCAAHTTTPHAWARQPSAPAWAAAFVQ